MLIQGTDIHHRLSSCFIVILSDCNLAPFICFRFCLLLLHLERIVKTHSMVCQCPSLPTEGYTIDKHWKALPRIVPSLLRSLNIALQCPPMRAILAYWIWSFSLLPLGAMAAIHRLCHRVAARAMTTSECACILGIAPRSRPRVYTGSAANDEH